jgi:hypothetical protein
MSGITFPLDQHFIRNKSQHLESDILYYLQLSSLYGFDKWTLEEIEKPVSQSCMRYSAYLPTSNDMTNPAK